LPDLLAGGVEGALGDLGGHGCEAPLHRALAHQLGVAAHVERARRVLRQRGEIGAAAGLVLVLARLDRLVDRDDVGGPVGADQLRHMAPDAPVVVAVEVLAGDQIRDAVEGLVVQEERAEQRLLGFYRMRRHAKLQDPLVRGSRDLSRIGTLTDCHSFLPSSPRTASYSNAAKTPQEYSARHAHFVHNAQPLLRKQFRINELTAAPACGYPVLKLSISCGEAKSRVNCRRAKH
jgi:hypothetical protein